MKTLTVREWQTSTNEPIAIDYELAQIAFIRFEMINFDFEIEMGLVIEFNDGTTATFKAENWFIDFSK